MENKAALLIIDVQVAMFSYEDEDLYNGEKVLENIITLINKARKSGVPVIFVQHTDSDDSEFARGKATWEIHPKIKPLYNEVIIEKTTCDSFYGTNLHDVLQQNGISKLIIAGMQTEFCVDTTCRRALSLGYENILVEDAHSTFDGEVLNAKQIVDHHNSVLGGSFAELKAVKEIEF